jgi:hypothetical protein
MKKLLLLFFLLSFQSFADDNSSSDCDYRISISNATIQVLEESQVIQQNFGLSRGPSSPGNKCSNYRVFFSKGLSNSYQRKAWMLLGPSINYNLHSSSNQSGVLKDYGDAVSSNEYVDGTAPSKNTTYSNRFYVSVPGLANTVVRSGTYFDIVEVRIYGFYEGRGWSFDQADSLTLVFYVQKNLQLSILDEGGVFDSGSTSKIMDFGILSLNNEKGADLRVLSNGSYKLRMSSQNNGELRNASNTGIDYTVKVNGSSVSLASSASSPVQIGSGDATTSAGDLYNIKVRISESTDSKPAGLYQDVITFTAIAN